MASDRWLVRSGGRILGPFKVEDLVERVRSREITIHDEVAAPMQPWYVISKKPDFEELVEEILRENLSDEVTNTEFSSMTQTLTVTETAPGMFDDSRTEKINVNIDGNTAVTDKATPPKQQQNNPPPVRSYGFEPNAADKMSATKWTNQLWIFVLLISAGIFAGVYITRTKNAPKDIKSETMAKLPVEDVIQLAQTKLDSGLYKSALSNYKQAFKLDPVNESLYIYLGALMTRLGDNEAEAKKFLTKAAQFNGESIQKRAYASMALLALKNADFDEAEKQLNKALLIDEKYYPAIINLAQISAITGNHNQSRAMFRMAMDLNSEPELTSFLFALSELQKKVAGESIEKDVIQNMLEEIENKQTLFYQESKLLSVYNRLDDLDELAVEAEVLKLLQIDPGYFKEFRWNLFVFRSDFNWYELQPFCKKVAAKMMKNGIQSTLLALCHVKSGDAFKANTLITKATTQSPNHPLVLANASYIKGQANLDREQNLYLKQAVNKNNAGNYVLPSVLRAKYCLSQGDKDCAISEAQKVLRADKYNLTSLAIMAHVYKYKGETQKARDYAMRGYKRTQEFIPLIRVSAAIDKGQ